MTVRRLATGFACALALVAAGCGNKHDVVTEGETEGIWVDVGGLDYHIQGSRQLNGNQVPDDDFLAGLPEGEAAPAADETWFAVFVRVENKTDAAEPTAEHFEIEDTNGTKYEPIELSTEENPFAYEPIELGENEIVPHPESTQMFNTSGAMLLFKIPLAFYASRPLELIIHAPEGVEGPPEAKIALDV